jgi:hypothetical protein
VSLVALSVSLAVSWLSIAAPVAAPPRPGAKPAGEVVIVLTRESQAGLIRVVADYEARLRQAGVMTAGTSRALLPLRDGDQVVLLWADSGGPAVESERDLLINSEVYELGSATPRDKGLSWTLGHTFPPDRSPRLADAVLVAGRGVAGWPGPRAVVLLTLPDEEDGSQATAGDARAELERLGVPFRVWTPAAEASGLEAAWGSAVSIHAWDAFEAEVSRLRTLLSAPDAGSDQVGREPGATP